MLGGESWLATLLFSLKEKFIPRLEVSDDYLYWDTIGRRPEVELVVGLVIAVAKKLWAQLPIATSTGSCVR